MFSFSFDFLSDNFSHTGKLLFLYGSFHSVQLISVQSLSRVRLFVTPWTAACQTSLSITNSRSLLKLRSIELVMPSNHLIFCRPLLLLPSIFPSIRVFSKESGLCIRWPKYWNFSFNISPSNEHPGLELNSLTASIGINSCFSLLFWEHHHYLPMTVTLSLSFCFSFYLSITLIFSEQFDMTRYVFSSSKWFMKNYSISKLVTVSGAEGHSVSAQWTNQCHQPHPRWKEQTSLVTCLNWAPSLYLGVLSVPGSSSSKAESPSCPPSCGHYPCHCRRAYCLFYTGGARGKEAACQCGTCKRRGFDSWVGKIPWSRKWQPTPVFLPGESHGQRSLGATVNRASES